MHFRAPQQISRTSLTVPFTWAALAAASLVCASQPSQNFLTVLLEFEGMALLSSLMLGLVFMPPSGTDTFGWLFSPSLEALRRILRDPVFYAAILCFWLKSVTMGL